MIIWTPILKWMTKLTGLVQQMAAREQWKQANLPAKVTIAHFPPLTKSSLPLDSNNKQQGGQVGYPAHQPSGRLPVEISPKPDLVDGQDANLQQRPIPEGTRRSDLCLKEAQKNREDGMPWLAEMNEAMAMINRHQEDTNTEQLQERANKALDKHLEQIEREIG